jgi:hypothetical protein
MSNLSRAELVGHQLIVGVRLWAANAVADAVARRRRAEDRERIDVLRRTCAQVGRLDDTLLRRNAEQLGVSDDAARRQAELWRSQVDDRFELEWVLDAVTLQMVGAELSLRCSARESQDQQADEPRFRLPESSVHGAHLPLSFSKSPVKPPLHSRGEIQETLQCPLGASAVKRIAP